MRNNKTKAKLFVMAGMISLLAITGCSQEPTPDDQRAISQEEKDNLLNAQTAPNLPAESIAPKPSMGPGVNTAAPVPSAAPVDNGATIMFPTLNETAVVPNEKVTFYAGQLTPGKVYPANLLYSANGQNDRPYPLGEFTVSETGEISEKVTIPANLAKGSYIVAIDVDGSLYTAPIKVG